SGNGALTGSSEPCSMTFQTSCRAGPWPMIPESDQLRDIVYPVRRGDWNLELRYSLRSLVNLPHARVILVGYVPSWANPDIGLIRDQGKEAPWHASAMHLLYAMDQIRDLSDPLYLFNDDFYVMQPTDQIPI